MAGVKDIVLQVSQLTKVEELNAVTAAVNGRLAVLSVRDGISPSVTYKDVTVLQAEEAIRKADDLKRIEAAFGGGGDPSDKKTT